MYNILQTNITCPHCSTLANVKIELFFGNTSTADLYVLGDQYKWVRGRAVQNGGRPEKGNLDGEGYTECPNCRRDFFVKVMVREDRIESVMPDTEKTGYIRASDEASALPSTEATSPAFGEPTRKPEPGFREKGRIFYGKKWKLTPKIQAALEQLVNLGVDVSSTLEEDDYTILAPHGLSDEQYEQIEALMAGIAKEVKGTVNYVDWYPHGTKFRIYPHRRSGPCRRSNPAGNPAEGATNAPALQTATPRKVIKNRPGRHNREEIQALRMELVGLAKDVLSGRIGVIEGARLISQLGHSLNEIEATHVLGVFDAIVSETDHLPVGKERDWWSESALQAKNDEILQTENRARDKIFSACSAIIEQYGEDA